MTTKILTLSPGSFFISTKTLNQLTTATNTTTQQNDAVKALSRHMREYRVHCRSCGMSFSVSAENEVNAGEKANSFHQDHKFDNNNIACLYGFSVTLVA